MGAGKTSVGRLLAQQIGWIFTDLDDVVEARAGRPIADIFQTEGEAAFRRAERVALQEMLQSGADDPPLVLALGGGAFVQPEIASALFQAGVPCVFLDASIEALRSRCSPEGAQRPLFQDENHFRQLYAVRHPVYMKADIRIDTTGLTVEQVAAEVTRRLGLV
jgi:shikimate kinase